MCRRGIKLSVIVLAKATQQRLGAFGTHEFMGKRFTRQVEACLQVLRYSQPGAQFPQCLALGRIVSAGQNCDVGIPSVQRSNNALSCLEVVDSNNYEPRIGDAYRTKHVGFSTIAVEHPMPVGSFL